MAEDEKVIERLTRVETKLDHIKEDFDSSMKNIYRAIASQNEALEKRVLTLEQNQSWLWKTVLGGLIIAIIGFFFKQ
jgi:BMFP domain-containing protein YqiC